jgi:LysM repeat protein
VAAAKPQLNCHFSLSHLFSINHLEGNFATPPAGPKIKIRLAANSYAPTPMCPRRTLGDRDKTTAQYITYPITQFVESSIS